MATAAQIKANRKNAKKAGRPHGSVAESTKMRLEMKRQLVERVNDQFGDLMDAMFDVALGTQIAHTTVDKNGDEHVSYVYKRPPDIKTLSYLTDQVIGKATLPIEIDDKSKQKMTLKRFLELQGQADSIYAKGKEKKGQSKKKTSPKKKKGTTKK